MALTYRHGCYHGTPLNTGEAMTTSNRLYGNARGAPHDPASSEPQRGAKKVESALVLLREVQTMADMQIVHASVPVPDVQKR